MRLWTVQGSDAFFILNRDGVLHCSSPLSAIEMDEGYMGAFSHAYAWMAGQMEKRMTVPRPEEELLLSDFDIWHCVLNGTGAYTDMQMEKRLDHYHLENGPKDLEELPRELRDYVVSSWERVFDLDRRDRFFSKMRRNRYIQATMWQIRSEWVRGYRML